MSTAENRQPVLKEPQSVRFTNQTDNQSVSLEEGVTPEPIEEAEFTSFTSHLKW